MDRSGWMREHVEVPIDGSHHRPIHVKPLGLTMKTPRQMGAWPTTENVLDLTTTTRGQGLREIALAPVGGLRDAVLMPMQMAFQKRHRPSRVIAGPAGAYERDVMNSPGVNMESLLVVPAEGVDGAGVGASEVRP
jgi:hypothetical protein